MYSVRSKTKQKQKSPSINFLPLMWGRVTLAAAHAEIRNQPAHCVSPRVSPFWNTVQKMKLRKSSKEMTLVVPELTEASPTISSRYLYTSQIDTPCRWWSHRSEGLWLLFGLCPAGPKRPFSGQGKLAYWSFLVHWRHKRKPQTLIFCLSLVLMT